MSVNLFGSQVVRNTPRINAGDAGATQAWRTWCEITSRPRQDTPDKRFAAQYRTCRADRMGQAEILSRVRAAAFLPPRPKDPSDVRRAVMTMRRDDLFRQGRALARQGADPVPFPRGGRAGEASTAQDVAAACGTPRRAWSLDEEAACGSLLDVPPEALRAAADYARAVFGTPDVFPSQLVLTRRRWEAGEVAPVARRDGRRVNDRGREELREVPERVFTVDRRARARYLAGESAAEVARFHALAPDGFWEAVERRVADGGDVVGAVAATEAAFGWSEASR